MKSQCEPLSEVSTPPWGPPPVLIPLSDSEGLGDGLGLGDGDGLGLGSGELEGSTLWYPFTIC